jgi:hypothetical protein
VNPGSAGRNVDLNFFQPALKAGTTREFTAMLVNDESKPLNGQLMLTLGTEAGKVLARATQPFTLAELGAATQRLALAIPEATGGVVKAIAQASGPPKREATLSRRWVKVAE